MPEDTTDYVQLYSSGQFTVNIINNYVELDSLFTDEEKEQSSYNSDKEKNIRKATLTDAVLFLELILQNDGWAADQDLAPFNEAIVTANNLISQL